MTDNVKNQWLDRIAAAVCIVVLFPVLLIRCIVGFIKSGSFFETIPVKSNRGQFKLLKFSTFFRGRSLAHLFNIASGKLVLVGDGMLLSDALVAQRNNANYEVESNTPQPCLINLKLTQEMSGTHYDEELNTSLSVGNRISILVRYVLIKLIVPNTSYYQPEWFSMLGTPIDNVTLDDAVNTVVTNARTGKKSRMAFVNADCLNMAYKDELYTNTLRHKTLVFADGIGIQIGAKILGVVLNGNVNGTDMLPRICDDCIENDLSIFLLGGQPGVADEAAANLTANHPGLKIAGTHHGYFDKSNPGDVIDAVNSSGAQIVLIAFGAPLQDIWIEEYADQLNASVLMGVGGLLDFHTTRISRSPKWVQDIGFEWVWRLKQEPMRLWRRYLIGNPLFLYRVRKQARVDNKSVNFRRFKNPYKVASSTNKRYQRQQYWWLLKLQLARIGKRLIDLAGSLTALVLISPVLLLVAILIKVESPGPVLFRQKRVGRYGVCFSMLKFRSMRTDAEEIKKKLSAENEVEGGVTFKMKSDPRITKVGKYIRKYSVDELPQLINIIKGDMSLVGPRPPVPSEVDLYTGRDRRRLEVIPGITGLWQVSGRSDTTFEQQVDLDIDYLESRGIVQDVLIMLKTVPAVFSGRGAY